MVRSVLLSATVLATAVVLPNLAKAQPVTGIYIGAGAGVNFEEAERVKSRTALFTGVVTPEKTLNNHQIGYAGVVSLGYGLGNGLRLELEGDYRYNRLGFPRAVGNPVISSGGREQKYGPMFNVLFDLDVGSPYVYPYIGAGAGYQWEDRRRTTVTLPAGGLSTEFSKGVDSGFAYQAIAGLAFPVPYVPGLSLTAEYRFFAMDGQRSYNNVVLPTAGTPNLFHTNVTQDFNHSLLLGLRYAFNVAPPPVDAAPAVVTPAQASRTYLVFFDWDRADLTDRARQIIAEAAQATTRTQVTRIEVSGHTDTTGTARYNQGLSVRRAQNVAAELVRLGVPRASITTQGFGFSRPLVSTGPGVREPQNRRVEIVLR